MIHCRAICEIASILLIDGITKETFDGKGNETQVDAVATNGMLTPGWRPGTGAYSLNPDCTGTQTIVVPGLPDLHLQIIVAQGGNTIRQVVIDPGSQPRPKEGASAFPKSSEDYSFQ